MMNNSIQEAVENYLKDVTSPSELYADARRLSSNVIYDIAKIVVILEDDTEIPIFDVEKYVYDIGHDTGFIYGYYSGAAPGIHWYYVLYYSQSFAEICTVENGKVKNRDKRAIKEVKCYSKEDVSVEDLMRRYELYSVSLEVFHDTLEYQVKEKHMEMPDFAFNTSRLLPAEDMQVQVEQLKDKLNGITKAYKNNDLAETAAGICNLMHLPSEYLWYDLQNSKMSLRPTIIRCKEIINKWDEMTKESKEQSEKLTETLKQLKA